MPSTQNLGPHETACAFCGRHDWTNPLVWATASITIEGLGTVRLSLKICQQCDTKRKQSLDDTRQAYLAQSTS